MASAVDKQPAAARLHTVATAGCLSTTANRPPTPTPPAGTQPACGWRCERPCALQQPASRHIGGPPPWPRHSGRDRPRASSRRKARRSGAPPGQDCGRTCRTARPRAAARPSGASARAHRLSHGRDRAGAVPPHGDAHPAPARQPGPSLRKHRRQTGLALGDTSRTSDTSPPRVARQPADGGARGPSASAPRGLDTPRRPPVMFMFRTMDARPAAGRPDVRWRARVSPAAGGRRISRDSASPRAARRSCAA